MKLESLFLRGAIGIQDGLGVDEIEIDFTKISPGLIVLIGPNGVGKTTLVENLVPYRFLRSRPGSLANEFFLKDSRRDLVVSMNGSRYRLLLNIDGVGARGAVKSFVYCDGEPLNPDGNSESYNKVVEEIFGSPDIFFRSVFMAQGSDSLYKLPPGERKELILNLIGQQRIQTLCEAASKQGDDMAVSLGKIQGEIEIVRASISDLGDLETTIATESELVKQVTGEKSALAGELAAQTRRVDTLEKLSVQQAEVKAKLDEVNRRLADIVKERQRRTRTLDSDLATIEQEASKVKKLIESAANFKIQLATVRQELLKLNDLRQERERLQDLKDQDAEVGLDIYEQTSRFAEGRHKNLKEIDDQKHAITRAKRQAETLEQVPCQGLLAVDAITIEQVEAIKLACRDCQFIKDAAIAADELPGWQQHVAELEKELTLRQSGNDTAVAELKTRQTAICFDKIRFEELKRQIAVAGGLKFEEQVPALERAIEDLREQQAMVEAAGRRKKALQAAFDQEEVRLAGEERRLVGDRSKLVLAYEPEIESNLVTARELVKGFTDKLGEASLDLAAAEQRLVTARENEERYRKALVTIGEHQARTRELDVDLADWRDLAARLSRNGGYQSFVVEAAGQQITPFANDLLGEFGLPWTIQIETLQPTADGKGEKEGFFVIINTPDGPRELSKLSGGQEVWIEAVIFQAVAHLLQQSTRRIETAIRDEADGALDPEKAMAYLRAIQAGHKLSGLDKTLLISHRPEIQRAIGQRIVFVPGEGIRVEV